MSLPVQRRTRVPWTVALAIGVGAALLCVASCTRINSIGRARDDAGQEARGTGGGGAGGQVGAGGNGGTAHGDAPDAPNGSGGTDGPVACTTVPFPTITGGVAGTLNTFNDNGGWCWYQDERVVVDTRAGKLLIGSVASGELMGSGGRNGHIEATVYDIATTKKTLYTLSTTFAGKSDEHNAPAFVIRPDGKYVGMWSGSRSDSLSRFSVFDGVKWKAEDTLDLGLRNSDGGGDGGGASRLVTYSNPWYIDDVIWSAVRVDAIPVLLISKDGGESWWYYAPLTSAKEAVSMPGYYKYWGNNSNRLDFIGTESHPRENSNNSLWHGYIQNGTVYNSEDKEIVRSLQEQGGSDAGPKEISSYTLVLSSGSTIAGVKLERVWNHDLVRYGDGTIAATGQARVAGTSTTDPDIRMLYFRRNGAAWKTTYLVNAGPRLYAEEPDHTGLSALHPDNPHVIYVSTTYDPRDVTGQTTTAKHEIYQGISCDDGATFQWTAITQGSTVDNLRPVVPKWDSKHTALLWLRGEYRTAQDFNLQVVGLLAGI